MKDHLVISLIVLNFIVLSACSIAKWLDLPMMTDINCSKDIIICNNQFMEQLENNKDYYDYYYKLIIHPFSGNKYVCQKNYSPNKLLISGSLYSS